jgi:chemotaxis protein methyltransferase CheR
MQQIISHIKNFHGKDLDLFSESFLQKMIDQRIIETGSDDTDGYLKLILFSPAEIENLYDSLNISYSLFFRNSIDFSIMERYILPELIQRNFETRKSVRIWSAACAEGQEAYSFAMIADDLSQKQLRECNKIIIATDISENALDKARKGAFATNAVQNVKLSYISKYFINKGQTFEISDQMKQKVEFSYYDLLDPDTTSPPSGIFGGYDIIICCNLLIYYKPLIQKSIMQKLYNSLDHKGFLMVDESEKLIVKSFGGFKLYSSIGNIFEKI